MSVKKKRMRKKEWESKGEIKIEERNKRAK